MFGIVVYFLTFYYLFIPQKTGLHSHTLTPIHTHVSRQSVWSVLAIITLVEVDLSYSRCCLASRSAVIWLDLWSRGLIGCDHHPIAFKRSMSAARRLRFFFIIRVFEFLKNCLGIICLLFVDWSNLFIHYLYVSIVYTNSSASSYEKAVVVWHTRNSNKIPL